MFYGLDAKISLGCRGLFGPKMIFPTEIYFFWVHLNPLFPLEIIKCRFSIAMFLLEGRAKLR